MELDWWILVFFFVGFGFGMAYRWLEVQNLQIQLFLQANDVAILEAELARSKVQI